MGPPGNPDPPRSSTRRDRRFWGPRAEDVIDDELRFHIEMRANDYAARGFSDEHAQRAALHRVGDLEWARQQCLTIASRRERRMRRALTIDALRQDIAFALRTLWRQGSWTAVATLTLALGIGANTAVFSVVHSLILNPLPYRDADRIVIPWRSDAKAEMLMAPDQKTIEAWRARAHSLEGIEFYEVGDVTLTGQGEPEVWRSARVQPSFAGFVGAAPLLGRDFRADDATAGTQVVMLSEPAWRRRFAAARDVIGRTLTFDGTPMIVVGVASPRMRLPDLAERLPDVWVVLPPDTGKLGRRVVARIRRGIATDAAARELENIAAQVSDGDAGKKWVFTNTRLTRPGVSFRQPLVLMAGAVGLLLVIACANVAHLLLARGAVRERELAIRGALGASRARLTRQLLTESLVLASAGCVAGIGVGMASLRVLVALRPAGLEPLSLVSLDKTVLGVAVLLAVVTGVVFGSIAAWHAARDGVVEILKGTAIGGTATRQRNRVRSALVVTEMALSAMLLVGATLLVRTVVNLEHIDPGFDTKGLYTMRFDRPRAICATVAECEAVTDQMLRRARALPGVSAATVASVMIPQTSGFVFGPWQALGAPVARATGSDITAVNNVLPDFFATLGIRLVAGRVFDAGSVDRGEIIINEALARRLWHGESAVGKQMRRATTAGRDGQTPDPWLTVVGVAPRTPVLGLGSEFEELVAYYPSRHGGQALAVRVKPGVDPSPALRVLATEIGAGLALPQITSVDRALADSIATQRFTMILLAIFAGLAVVLSAVGLYGVIAYLVAQRTREIGIRMALGATRRDIARLVMRNAVVLSILGLTVGLTAARWGTSLLSALLYGVSRVDALSYTVVAIVLIGVSSLASLVPLRRAFRVDPLTAIRAD